MYFQCPERLFMGPFKGVACEFDRGYLFSNDLRTIKVNQVTRLDNYHFWIDRVKNYSKRERTVLEDKLIAISELTSLYVEEIKATYVAEH